MEIRLEGDGDLGAYDDAAATGSELGVGRALDYLRKPFM
jgi:hypothetical protein